MTAQRLTNYLNEKGVPFTTIDHGPTFTSRDTARASHVPSHDFAKIVVVRVEGDMALAVLPASERVDFALLEKVVGSSKVELVAESEFRARFPDCEPGAMPPFGNLYGMQTYVDAELATEEQVVFNAGDHIHAIRLAWTDYERLVQPRIGHFEIS